MSNATCVDHEVIRTRIRELSGNEFLLWFYLKGHAEEGAFPSRNEIVEQTGLCRDSVTRAMAGLEEKGWLRREWAKGKKAAYQVITPQPACKSGQLNLPVKQAGLSTHLPVKQAGCAETGRKNRPVDVEPSAKSGRLGRDPWDPSPASLHSPPQSPSLLSLPSLPDGESGRCTSNTIAEKPAKPHPETTNGHAHTNGAATPAKPRRAPSVARPAMVIPPLVGDVEAYFTEKGQPGRGEEFVDYYAARGWYYKGNLKMRDWRAAVRLWLKPGSNRGGSNGHDASLNSMTLQESAAIELERIRILGLCPENA